LNKRPQIFTGNDGHSYSTASPDDENDLGMPEKRRHVMFWIEFAVLLLAIFIGIRVGGLGLGLIGARG
jgi:hypothetical protein